MARKDVAAELNITTGTLQNHIEAIYLKLDVKTVEQMVLIIERVKVADVIDKVKQQVTNKEARQILQRAEERLASRERGTW